MVKKSKNTLITLIIFFAISHSFAQQQDQQLPERQNPLDVQQGWTSEISLGLDFMSNLVINPAVGAGGSRLGVNGSLDFNFEYQDGPLSWYGIISLNYGIQKNGTGVVAVIDTMMVDTGMGMGMPDPELQLDTTYVKVPFQKNIDNIWINTRAALRTSYFSSFYYTADLFFNSQFTRTYEGNYLSDFNRRGYPVARFLAPGTLQFSVGMDYKPNDYVTFFLSPASLKAILVLDDNIADDVVRDRDDNVKGTVHGNPFTLDDMGNVIAKNTDLQVGAVFRMTYDNEITPTIALSSNLMLFSDYLNSPDHIDVNWRNELNITIFKGLKFSLLSFLNYDHDIFVQKTDNSRVGGVGDFTRSVSYTQQFLLKYTYAF